jgi:hypothetical protein
MFSPISIVGEHTRLGCCWTRLASSTLRAKRPRTFGSPGCARCFPRGRGKRHARRVRSPFQLRNSSSLGFPVRESLSDFCVAQTSQSAVSRVSKPASHRLQRCAADLEIGNTAGLETCATTLLETPYFAGADGRFCFKAFVSFAAQSSHSLNTISVQMVRA